ncbi:MAG: hypothetical protein AB7P49_00665 [Bdellovibrionales bacterium]
MPKHVPGDGSIDYTSAHHYLSRLYDLSPFPETPPETPHPQITGVFKNVVVIFRLMRDDGRLPVIPSAHAMPGRLPESRSDFSGFQSLKFPYSREGGGAVLLLYPDGTVNSTGARSVLDTALSAAWLRNTLRLAYGVSYSVQDSFVKTNTVICAKLPWKINLDRLRTWKHTAQLPTSLFPGVFIHIGKINASASGADADVKNGRGKQATVSILLYEWCVIISGMTDLSEANMLLVLLIPSLDAFRKDKTAHALRT